VSAPVGNGPLGCLWVVCVYVNGWRGCQSALSTHVYSFIHVCVCVCVPLSLSLSLCAEVYDPGMVTFRDVYPRPHPNRTWEGLWGRLSARAYAINLDWLEYVADVHRYARDTPTERERERE
jgi:hypothetical protein